MAGKKLLIAFLATYQLNLYAFTLNFSEQKSIGADTRVEVRAESNQTVISVENRQLNFKSAGKGLFKLSQKKKSSKLMLANTQGMAVLPFHSVILEEVSPKKKVKVKFKKNKVRMAFLSGASGSLCRCDKDFQNSLNSVVQKASKDTPKYELSYLGDYRGKKLYKLNIYPHRYKRGLLMASGSMQVKLKGLVPFQNEEIGASGSSRNYLLVGPSFLLNAMGEWIDYREGQGHRVEKLSSDGFKSAEALKLRIHQEIASLNLDSLLILGNENIVPMFSFKTRFDEFTPSDLPYALTGGNGDWIPDVDYGRFPVTGASELESIIAKIIAFESRQLGPVNDLRALGMASNEGMNPNDFEYLQAMLTPMQNSLGYENQLLHQNDPLSNANTISSAFKSGVDWVNYIGHGSGTSWPSINRGEYTSSDLLAVGAMERFPVVIDVACQNGRMNGAKRLGESFLLASRDNQLSGAVAYFGGTVDISWDPPALMAIGINQSVAEKKWDTLYKNILEGQFHLMRNVENLDDLKDNLIWYHLQGDPGLVLF